MGAVVVCCLEIVYSISIHILGICKCLMSLCSIAACCVYSQIRNMVRIKTALELPNMGIPHKRTTTVMMNKGGVVIICSKDIHRLLLTHIQGYF